MKLLTCYLFILGNFLLWHSSLLKAQSNDEIFLLPPVEPADRAAPGDTLAHHSGIDEFGLQSGPIAERIQHSLVEAEEVAEHDVPLAEEVEIIEEQTPGGWFYPRIWRPSEIWEGCIEVGINGSQGNTETLSLTSGANASRTRRSAKLSWDLVYLKTQTNSIETQHNALMSVDYDYDFEESCWSWFTKFYGEYDEFKAFDVRLSVNGGAGYNVFKTETKRLTGRFGAGWSREINGPDNRFVPEATVGGHYERQLMGRQKLVLDSQYLPEWENFSFYRMINDVHWQILLNEASDLHLKIGIIDRYDSTPNGAEANDLTYSVLLLWKL